jgi:salicylate hydroxylase
MMKAQLDIVILGGGIGGLFAANALIARGLRVSVYEQAPALGEIGAGVFLTPKSVRQLQRVGLGPAVEKRGARVGPGSRYFRHDGAPIAPVQVTDSAGWNATFGMHRADLVEILAGALPAHVVHTGHRATACAQDGEVARVTFAHGAVAEGDIVIAADGIHSELRQCVAPPSRPVFSGSVAYRGLVPHERIAPWPTGRPLPRPSWLMSACAASGWRGSSAARARTGCATTPPTPTSASAMPRSPPTRHSAGGSTTMTWSRKHKPRQ